MRTKTFFTPCCRYRLVVTRSGETWTAELRQSTGVSIMKAGDNADDVTGELFMIAQQRTGDLHLMAALFGLADEAIDNGEFSEVLTK